jgi:hypothetical protein
MAISFALGSINTKYNFCFDMDTLALQKYQLPSVGYGNNAVNGRKVRENTTVNHNELQKSSFHRPNRQFLEFFINHRPLSQQIDEFFHPKKTVLESYRGTIGWSSNTAVDIVKVKQLLGKKISDAEIRQVYPANFTEDEFSVHLEWNRAVLSDPLIRIYCCRVCGGYDCGGIDTIVIKTETSVFWKIAEGQKFLQFEFDKHQYFEVLGAYLKKIGG